MSSAVLGDLLAQLQHMASQSNAARSTAYAKLITELVNTPAANLNAQELLQATSLYLQNAVFSEQNSTGGGLVTGRQALSAFEKELAAVAMKHSGRADDSMQDDVAPAIADSSIRRQVLENSLEQLQPRVLSFEEQASSLRIQLASLLEAEEEWTEAAQVLYAIPLDSGHRNVSDQFKLSIYMRIVRLLLEGDDSVAADVYLKRASMVIHNVPGALSSKHLKVEDPISTEDVAVTTDIKEAEVLGLQFRLSQAKIYDSQRRFAEAAARYHELSSTPSIDDSDRTQMLSAAVTASILSPAGPQRAKMLTTLMRDERTQSLPQYTILSKVFLDHIIRSDEIKAFEKMLSPHQVARLGASSASSSSVSTASVRDAPLTVLDRAMIEHNVLSASRVYDNITLAGLGALVELSPEGAEDIARKMIMQGRLKGWIDQLGTKPAAGQHSGGTLFFIDQQRHAEGAITAGGLGATTGVAQVENDTVGVDGICGAGTHDADSKWTRRWDQEILQLTNVLEGVCQRLNKTAAA